MPRTRPALIKPFVVQCGRVGREHRERIIPDLRGLSFMDGTGVHLPLRSSQRALKDAA